MSFDHHGVEVQVIDENGDAVPSSFAAMDETTLHPIGRLWRTSNQSISNAAYTQIDFDTSYSLSAQGILSDDGANDRFTLTQPLSMIDINADPTPSRIFVELMLCLTYNPTTATEFQGYIVKNATTVPGNYIGIAVVPGSATCTVSPTVMVHAVDEAAQVGDFYTFFGRVTGAGAVNVLGNKYQIWASAKVISWN